MPDGSTVECKDVPTEGPEDCGPRPVEYCYTITNVGDECGNINSIDRTRTPPGTTESLLGLVAPEDRRLCPGDEVVICEADTVDTCDKSCYETTIEVNAQMPETGFVCSAMDEYEFCVEPGCNVDVDTECVATLPDGSEVPCTEIPSFPPDDCPTLETEYCYTISNIGQSCGDITKFERTRTPPGTTEDLLDLIRQRDRNLCPGETIRVCETDEVDTCVKQCYETTVVVEATMPDSFVCEAEDEYQFCTGPGCKVKVETTCETEINGETIPCTDIPTESPEDCGPIDIEYCYTVDNIGASCGVMTTFERTWTATRPGTPNTRDLLPLFYEQWPEDQEYCPDDPPITVCETVGISTCDKVCYETSVVIDATMPDGFVCEADGEYDFCVEPGTSPPTPNPTPPPTPSPTPPPTPSPVGACKLTAEVQCTATLENGQQINCEDMSPTVDDCGPVSKEYCYVIDNIGNECGDITAFQRTRTPPGGAEGTQNLLPLLPTTNLCPNDPPIRVCEAPETIDSCDDQCYLTEVIVEATMPGGFVCEAEDLYELCVNPGCRIETEITCTLADGSGTACEDFPGATVDECGPTPVQYCYKIDNVGPTCGTINKIDRTRTPPGTTEDILGVLIPNPEDRLLCEGESITVCEIATVDTCVEQCYETNIEVDATMADGFVCEALDEYEFCVPPPPIEACNVEVDLECKMDPSQTIDGSTSCDVIIPIATRCDNRAAVMTWRFNGGDCEQSFNIQEADKFTCTDFAGGAPTEGSAWLTVTSVKDESDVYFDGEVRVGDLFSMFAGNTNKGKFDADSFFYVYSDSSKTNLLQLSSVHTSCSQNLFLKDKFGSVQLLIFENEFGLFTCFVQATYGFTLTNQGAADSGTIVEFTSTTNGVADDCLSAIPDGGGTVQPGDTVIVDKQVLIDMTVRQEYNTVAYIRAETPGGFSCDDTSTLQFTAGNPNLPTF